MRGSAGQTLLTVLEVKLRRKRSRGRRQRGYTDDLKQWTGRHTYEMKRMAEDREAWRDHVPPSVEEGIEGATYRQGLKEPDSQAIVVHSTDGLECLNQDERVRDHIHDVEISQPLADLPAVNFWPAEVLDITGCKVCLRLQIRSTMASMGNH
ncbi:hypothetical protein LAZ67_15000538 [Cordylochernes scorpioides]|uniref:Uncharacterized protein n=1 Tax=Cordylochernes scorpioides TaxID=51811 RepID=A0ABY6L8G9_9ARAC|nr:hypothetical protein LAZ67_15000538 [Cordylochernes scorpioides]